MVAPESARAAPARAGGDPRKIERFGGRLDGQIARDCYEKQAFSDVRLRLLARRLHALGERATYEFLREIVAGCDPIARLEAYAALDAGVLAALNGRDLSGPAFLAVEGALR